MKRGLESEGVGHRGWAAETEGINLYSEHSLHARLKEHLAGPGDRLEALVEGKVVDLVKADGELVEVQTANLGKITRKVLGLAASGRRVRVVHPIAVETIIRRLDPLTGELLSVRKSPKRGDFWSLFDELVRAPELIAAPNVTVEVLLVRNAVIRVRDGSGSWRRRGDSTKDRLLEEILSSVRLESRKDWLGLIPRSLDPPWSSALLGEELGIEDWRARKVLYSLCRAGLLTESGLAGRRKLYVASRRRATRAARK
ncbi:MAG TPA: hypothetical protein VMC79_11610 [Rectinemataceae bacterium]|nr:hypothetical protein [Rectinemataceae bacterium]